MYRCVNEYNIHDVTRRAIGHKYLWVMAVRFIDHVWGVMYIVKTKKPFFSDEFSINCSFLHHVFNQYKLK